MNATLRLVVTLLLTLMVACSSDGEKTTGPERPGTDGPTVSVAPPGPLGSVVGRETFAPKADEGSAPPIGPRTDPPPKKDPRFDRPISPVGPLTRKDPKTDEPKKPDPPEPTKVLAAAQQKVLDELAAAYAKNAKDWTALAQVVSYLLSIDQPVMAERFLADEKALDGYPGTDHTLNLALSRLDRRLGRSEAGYKRLRKATDAEGRLMPLSIPTAQFVTENPPSFGLQRRRASNTFKAGGFFRLYLEIADFVLRDADADQYNAAFKIQLKILATGGDRFPWPRWTQPKEIKRQFRSRIRDLFILPKDNFPASMQPGDYELIVELVDMNKPENSKAVVRTPFKITGD